MPMHYLSISDITPKTKKHWAVKVQVAAVFPIRVSATSRRYQKYILSDKEGMTVQATVFDSDIDLLADLLLPLEQYVISNAFVSYVDPQHRIVDNKYQWVLSSKTPIKKLVNDTESSAIQRQFQEQLSLVPFSNLDKYANTISQVDVLAVVVDMYPQKSISTRSGSLPTRELLIVNEEKRPILLTLWDQYTQHDAKSIEDKLSEWPIILAMRLKVTTYNELSLSTKSASSFLVNPNIAVAQTLRTWTQENVSILEEIKATSGYYVRNNSAQAPTTIADILTSPSHDTYFKVTAHATIKNTKQSCWYMCCNKCNNAIEIEYNANFKCHKCKQTATAQPRCCIQIQLQDSTGELSATIYGKNAEKIFPFTAHMLMNNQKEDDIPDLSKFESLETKKFVFSLKCSIRQESKIRFVVSSVCDDPSTPK